MRHFMKIKAEGVCGEGAGVRGTRVACASVSEDSDSLERLLRLIPVWRERGVAVVTGGRR